MTGEFLPSASEPTGIPYQSSNLPFEPVELMSAKPSTIPRHQRVVRKHDSIRNGQWTDIPPEERNIHQRVAAATGGVVTRANGISLLGGTLTSVGIELVSGGMDRRDWKRTTVGVGCMALGRLCDLKDGSDAEKNGVKGNFGALEDATIDKVNAAHALLRFGTKSYINPWIATASAGMQVTNAACAVAQGTQANSSSDGKRATFAFWAAGGIELGANIAQHFGLSNITRAIKPLSHTANVIQLAMNTKATAGYVRSLVQNKQRKS